jgi:hypothetical protein
MPAVSNVTAGNTAFKIALSRTCQNIKRARAGGAVILRQVLVFSGIFRYKIKA